MSSKTDLFTSDEVTKVAVLWICLWTLGHYIFWPLWNHHRFWVLVCRPTPLDRYRRRLCRSQVYCFLAVVGGVHLLSQCRWQPSDLLLAFSKEHQLLFSMAVGHWLVAIWEDIRSSDFLSAGIREGDIEGLEDPDSFFLQAYVVHHLVAGCCFGAVMALQSCTGLATFGLLFELPVLLMNHREFAIYADTKPKWFLEYSRVESFWDWLHYLFFLARGSATLTYLYSLAVWLDDVTALPWPALLVYHFMAIFFSLLNFGAVTFHFPVWMHQDKTKAVKSHDAGFEDMPCEEKIAQDTEGVDESKRLTMLPPDFWEQLTAPGIEDREVWMEIDGIVYRLTDFVHKHPGGSEVLRKHHGQDASESFHRVRHSGKAKRMMQEYVVGPIEKRPRSYRLGEHGKDGARTDREAIHIFGSYGLAAVLLPRSLFAVVGHDVPLAVAVVPGLMVAVMGGVAFWALLLFNTSSVLEGGFSWGAGLVTVCMLLHIVALSLARDPWSIDNPTCPTAIEIGAWTVFLIEEVDQLWRYGARGWLGRILISFCFLSASWAMRGMEAASTVVGVLLGATATALCHRAGDGRPKQQVASEILVGAALAAPCSALVLYYLSTTDPDVLKALDTWRKMSLTSFCIAELIAILVFFALGVLVNCTHICSASWASRCWSIGLFAAAGLAGGFSWWRCLTWIAWLWHLTTLGNRLAEEQAEYITNDTFKDLHPYQVGTRSCWDMYRSIFLTTIWYGVLKPVRFIVNAVLPEEFWVFAAQTPIFTLGDSADLGVTAYFAPAGAALAPKGPEYFECNVGHVDLQHPSGDGVLDLHVSMNTLRDTWAEFRPNVVKGLLAEVVCFFPSVRGTGVAKQIQWSCWQTSDDAQAWHAESRAYKHAQRQQNGLRTGGGFVAELQTQGHARIQDKCRNCARVVESERLGTKAPRDCPYCGGKTFGHPFC